jgi:hypothetical protein
MRKFWDKILHFSGERLERVQTTTPEIIAL